MDCVASVISSHCNFSGYIIFISIIDYAQKSAKKKNLHFVSRDFDVKSRDINRFLFAYSFVFYFWTRALPVELPL